SRLAAPLCWDRHGVDPVCSGERAFEVRWLEARSPIGDALAIALGRLLVRAQHHTGSDRDEFKPALPGRVGARPPIGLRDIGPAINRVAYVVSKLENEHRWTDRACPA